jgi:DNA-directed RNA polymerase specialized sigma24 family protein
MGGNSTEAEDALSMAMLKAREKLLKGAKVIENLKAWLTKLTYNLCLDILRQRDRLNEQVEDVELLTSSVADCQEENPILAA